MSFVKKMRSNIDHLISEIFEEFERRVTEYEEEISRLNKENCLQRKELDAIYKPEVRLFRLDLQQLLATEKYVPLEEQEWSPSWDQEASETSNIKEEEEELGICQREEHPQKAEKDCVSMCPFFPVSFKSENDEEKPLSTHHRQTQSVCREVEPSVSTITEEMKTEPNEEKSGLSKSVNNQAQDCDLETTNEDQAPSSDPCQHETEDSDDGCSKTREPHSSFVKMNNIEIKHQKSIKKKAFSCSVCRKRFSKRGHVQRHMRIHKAEKFLSCSVCGKEFARTDHLQTHMRIHTGEKPFRCSVCGKAFSQTGNLQSHMRTHTGHKPFTCTDCGKGFSDKRHLLRHMTLHT